MEKDTIEAIEKTMAFSEFEKLSPKEQKQAITGTINYGLAYSSGKFKRYIPPSIFLKDRIFLYFLKND